MLVTLTLTLAVIGAMGGVSSHLVRVVDMVGVVLIVGHVRGRWAVIIILPHVSPIPLDPPLPPLPHVPHMSLLWVWIPCRRGKKRHGVVGA